MQPRLRTPAEKTPRVLCRDLPQDLPPPPQALLRVLDECVFLTLRNPAAGDLPAATVSQLLAQVLVETCERPPTAKWALGRMRERLQAIIGLQIPPGSRLAQAAQLAHARLAATR